LREKIKKTRKIIFIFLFLAIFVVNISFVSAIDLDSSVTSQTIKSGLDSPDEVINLTGTFKGTDNVNLTINKNVIIQSKNPANLATIDGEGVYRLFNINSQINVKFENIIFNNSNGSAISSNNGTLTFINCRFENNTATNFGGAISSTGVCSVTIENCRFENNTATNFFGGAIAHQSSGLLAISDTQFIKNQATSSGGAIASLTSCNVTIENCKFENNTATNDYGGAIIHGSSGSLAISDTQFIKNQATSSGGAIFLGTGSGNVTIENCRFENNNATDDGGAIYLSSSGSLAISDTFFIKNEAARGGAIYMWSSSANISYSLFYSNQATIGGGAIYYTGSCVIINNGNSLSGNSFDDSDVPCLISANVVSGSTIVNLTSTLPKGSYYFVIRDGTTNVLSGFVSFSGGVGSITLVSTLVSGKSYNITAYKDISISEVYATGGFTVSAFVGDYSSLQTAIIAAMSLNSALYTTNSWSTLQSALSPAIQVNTIQNAANQGAIDALTSALNTAIANLVLIGSGALNYNGLQTAINTANGLNSALYTASSWFTLQGALTPAVAMNTAQNAANQGVIDGLSNALFGAIGNLVPLGTVSDNSALLAAINALNNAISKLEQSSTKPNSGTNTANKVNFASAIDSEVKSNLQSKDYSPASWKVYLKALSYAHKVNNSVNPSQSEIDKAIIDLKKAKVNLKKRNVDLKITKVKRSGNSYKITIKNSGRDVSTKTQVKIYCGGIKLEKVAKVKAISAGKSITLTVKFFKYSQTKKYDKYFVVNFNKTAMETNFKNNKFKILKN